MPDVYDKKFFKTLLIAVGIVACSALLMRIWLNHARAAETLVINTGGNVDDWGGTCYERNAWQSFKGTGDFITRVEWYGYVASTTWVYVKICDTDDCSGEVFKNTYFNPMSQATSTFSSLWFTIDYESEHILLDNGVTYYINFYEEPDGVACAVTNMSISIDVDNPYADGRNWVNASYDYNIKFYTDDDIYDEVTIYELPTWEGEIYVGAESANIPTYIDCLVGQVDCQTWVNYTFGQIGYDAYLIEEDEGIDINAAVASSTNLAMKLVMREFFTLPSQATATTIDYCVLIVDSDNLIDEYLCDTTVFWTSEADLGLPVYDIESACDDVEASDESTWDDMRYGIECAFRKVIYWAFTPHATSTMNLRSATEDFKKNFPMSVVNDFSVRFDAIAEYEGQALSVPIGLYQDKNMPEAEPITYISLSTTTLMTYTDEDFYDMYYFYAQLFLYLLLLFYIFIRVFSILKREPNDY